MEDQDHSRRHEIAARVRYWTDRRGMTREVFAGRMGRSVSLVGKIRSGDRVLDRLSVLEQIAEVLDVPIYVLIDAEQSRRTAECVDAAEIKSIRIALQRYDAITHVLRPTNESRPSRSLVQLDRQLGYAWSAFQAGDYSALGPALGGLMTDAQYAVVELTGDDQQRAARMLAQCYQIATSTLRKLGQFDLEWLAAERGVIIAEQTDSPVLMGGAVFRLVNALRDTDSPEAAVTAAVTAIDRLQPVLDVDSPAHLSLYGHLMLQGAMAASAKDDPSATRDLLRAAHGVAVRLGSDRNDYWTSFGPTNVEIHRAAANVELGHWTAALDAATSIDPQGLALLPKERRANHLVDVARAYSLGARHDEAVSTLLAADDLAPKEVRCRPVSREVVADLWRRSRRSPSLGLRQLAERVGIAA